MKKTIAILPGDGIGPEVMSEALNVLNRVAKNFGHTFVYQKGLIGGAAYLSFGEHFPEETQKITQSADAILFGSVGGPVNQQHLAQWKDCERHSILALRKKFGFNTNLRPIKIYPSLLSQSVLKPEIASRGVDLLCVRELSQDIYFGEHSTRQVEGQWIARDVMEYSEETIRRISHSAFKAALKRRNKVSSIDKANVLDCSRLWRKIVSEVAESYPNVELEHFLVDNAAMQLMQRPDQFDVLLMPNLFGDILSDEACVLSGSLGLLPSASLNPEGFGLYEPAGGSAPDLAGKNVANPIAQILSAALMLRYSFGLEKEACSIEKAVEKTLEQGFCTADLTPIPSQSVSTSKMGEIILSNLI